MRASIILISMLMGLSPFVTIPAVAAECGPLNLLTTLPIKPVGRPGNVVTVQASIADKPVSLLIDTGDSQPDQQEHCQRAESSNPAVSRSACECCGTKNDARSPATVDNARPRAAGRRLLIVNSGTNPVGGGADPFDGILGADFLLNVDVDLDYGAGKLNLISPQHCYGKVVYWQAPVVAVVPIRVDAQGKIRFPLTLDGHSINAILDTGATYTSLNLDVAKRVFNINTTDPDLQKIGELKGGFTAQIYDRQFKTLSIEGVTVTDPVISLLPNMVSLTSEQRATGSLVRDSDKQSPDLLLGMSVLSKLHVYIAAHEGKLYITAANPQPQPTP